MSILSIPVVADTVARMFAATVNPTPKAAVCFADIPARTRWPASPLATALSPQRFTTHRQRWNPRRCTSTSTAADSSSGTLSKTTHGAGTWPPTPASWW